MPVLVVSSRLTESRRRALVRLVGAGAVAELTGPGEARPALTGFDAVIVDGPPDPSDERLLDDLVTHVECGASLLVLGVPPAAAGGRWGELLGAAAVRTTPLGEYLGTVTGAASVITQRVDGEFAFVDCVDLLAAPGLTPLLEVSVGYTGHPVVAEGRWGRGRLVVSGVGNRDQALASPAIATMLRRALRPPGLTGVTGVDIGLAVVGYGPHGGMGLIHGTAAAATPGLELVAVCDPSPDRRKAAEADFPGVATYASVDELLHDDAAELIVLATPPTAHATLALQVLRAGRHVACEKPLCFTVAQADELMAAAGENGRVLTVHQNRRWDPDFLALRRAVDAGLLGDVFNMETFVGGFEHPCRAWHSDVVMSGGAVYDWGSHHLDWILQLMGGIPESVVTHGHKRVWHDVTNLDQLRVHLTWADGREAEFLQSDVAGIRRPKFYVQGTAGTVAGHYRPVVLQRMETGRGYVQDVFHHAEAPAELTLARYDSGVGLTESRLPPAPIQVAPFHRNLADHLHLGEPLAVTAESVRRVVAVLEGAQRSSDGGGVGVALPAA